MITANVIVQKKMFPCSSIDPEPDMYNNDGTNNKGAYIDRTPGSQEARTSAEKEREIEIITTEAHM